MFCREQVARLAARRQELDATGATVVIVGSGWPEMAKAFAEDHDVPFLLLVDPDRHAYRAAGFTRGLGATFNRATLAAGRRALAAGFRQGLTQGDPWQQGGALVLRPGGAPELVQRAAHAGDHVDEDALVAAARRAAG